MGISLRQYLPMSLVQLALRRPYTFIVMAMLIVLATPLVLRNMATDIFPEINIPVVSIIWNYNGLPAQEMGQRIFEHLLRVASGEKSKSEDLGVGKHEFVPWQISVIT